MKRNRIVAGAAAAAATALVLAGCSSGGTDDGGATDGGNGDLTPVTLQLQWLTQAQFGGYYLAKANGYWEDLGLDVEIIPGAVDIVPQDVLAAGDVDFAIAWVPKALASIEAGANITDIAQIFERSATLQVSWADSGIKGPEDLSGKQVGSEAANQASEVMRQTKEQVHSLLDDTKQEIQTQAHRTCRARLACCVDRWTWRPISQAAVVFSASMTTGSLM